MPNVNLEGTIMLSTTPKSGTVSVLGLGAMGTALARALLSSGHHVTVWNRNKSRGAALAQEGASLVADISQAISASELIVVCLIDKQTSENLLKCLPEAVDLTGRTFVNVSTGSAEEAKRIDQLISYRKGSYLDGGIMCYPKDIGAASTAILYSGSEEAYLQHESILRDLAGQPYYLGSNPETCAPTYLALYVAYFGAIAAWMEGAVLASTAGVSINDFGHLSTIITDMLVDGIKTATQRIDSEHYTGDQASIDVHVAGQELVLQAQKDANAPHLTTDAYLNYCYTAQEQKLGDLDIACLFKAIHP